jgi:hypothetical protein
MTPEMGASNEENIFEVRDGIPDFFGWRPRLKKHDGPRVVELLGLGIGIERYRQTDRQGLEF